MLKAIVITKTAKAIVNEAKKYQVTASLDKNTSKLVVTIQRKK